MELSRDLANPQLDRTQAKFTYRSTNRNGVNQQNKVLVLRSYIYILKQEINHDSVICFRGHDPGGSRNSYFPSR